MRLTITYLLTQFGKYTADFERQRRFVPNRKVIHSPENRQENIPLILIFEK